MQNGRVYRVIAFLGGLAGISQHTGDPGADVEGHLRGDLQGLSEANCSQKGER